MDEHKLLIMYGQPLEPFEETLIRSDVYPDPQLRFITEAEYVHRSSERLHHEFNVLKNRLGMDGDNFAGAW